MAVRILASAALLFSVLFLPLWVSVALAFGAMIYFRTFAEAVILFLLSDVLYGVSGSKYYGSVYVSFLSFFLALFIIELFKRKLRFYS